ncbi:hypothetical protein ACFQE0_23295 [Methylobacterium komagatae]|jgi:hypothetical protein|uniref:Uncharacterized protein n=1 Tax=Methylobacterium komagatae TaxID=374425 RepID=A0ABW2BSE0_9HYPH
MSALTFVSDLGADTNRPWALRAPRVVGFIAALVLVSTTRLPWTSVARLVPQADDHTDPFIGI